MHVYRVAYHTYEGNGDTLFLSDKKLSNKGLRDCVNKASRKVLEYALGHPDEFFWGARGEGPNLENIYEKLVAELEQMGFKRIDRACRAEWTGSGWDSFCSKDYNPRHLEMMALAGSLPERLKQRVRGVSLINYRRLLRSTRKSAKKKRPVTNTPS
ncbi:hypothetical protein J4447_00805 [Candidatus Pacearchaeota archaeon]|nr:hypothetical protein [Candidatus Pacearchaeota archaeon]